MWSKYATWTSVKPDPNRFALSRQIFLPVHREQESNTVWDNPNWRNHTFVFNEVNYIREIFEEFDRKITYLS